MSTGLIVLIVVLAVLLVAGISVIVMYNRFVAQRNLVAESWRQIDVELKRRYDLIPNLIETVKAFASHERQVFDSVVAARNAAMRQHDAPGNSPAAQAGAEQHLSGSLGRLFAVAENYPTLKSDANFVNLQHEMTDTEDRIAAGRRFYNGNVRALNTRVESFPSNVIANMFGFAKEQYFELDDVGARDAVRADFSSLTGSGPSDRDSYRQPAPPQHAAYRPEVTGGDPAPQFPAQPETRHADPLRAQPPTQPPTGPQGQFPPQR